MIFRVPSYYNTFRCTADKCTDNCCIGWEIEIDSYTADYYKSVEGKFGDRLCESISEDNTFILKGERCPFLNKENLCDIIINCGEERICQICRDHPRFFEWYDNIKEGGIGLSCEEGARLILDVDKVGYDECVVDEEPEEVDDELFSLLYSAREEILAMTDCEDKSFAGKVRNILMYTRKLQFHLDNPHLTEKDFHSDAISSSTNALKEMIGLFGEFEPIDESWCAEYEKLCTINTENVENQAACEKYAVNIFRYFIWRYFLKGVFDGEILSKVKFAAVSAIIIKLMTDGSQEIGVWVEKSKLYSKQMEYSDENRELFYDMSYENECFAANCITEVCDKMF